MLHPSGAWSTSSLSAVERPTAKGDGAPHRVLVKTDATPNEDSSSSSFGSLLDRWSPLRASHSPSLNDRVISSWQTWVVSSVPCPLGRSQTGPGSAGTSAGCGAWLGSVSPSLSHPPSRLRGILQEKERVEMGIVVRGLHRGCNKILGELREVQEGTGLERSTVIGGMPAWLQF